MTTKRLIGRILVLEPSIFDGSFPAILGMRSKPAGRIPFSIKPSDDVYVDEPYLSIRWDSLHKHVLSEWKGFANSEELRAGLLKGVQAITDNRAAAYVSDARRLRVIVHEDQRWIQEKWMPLAMQAGLRRLAFVTAGTGLGRLTVEDVSVLVDNHGLESRTFSSVEAARHWVAEVAVTR